jgi:hypothetical protein
MWPWEHFAVAYVAVSLWFRAARRRPGAATVLAVGVGSQFPDLVDKPLAWSVGVLPSGTALAHSVFVAVPLAVLAWRLARTRGRGALGLAFGLSYLLHLPGDLAYGLLTSGGAVPWGAVLWPLVPSATAGPAAGLLTETAYYVSVYLGYLSDPRAVSYLVFEAVLVSTAAGLWVADGYPGLRPLYVRCLDAVSG